MRGEVDVFRPSSRSFSSRHPPTADIEITTPGRLADHLFDNRPPLFPVDQLRYLVIDEVDRLDRDSRFGWFGRLEQLVYETRRRPVSHSDESSLQSLSAAANPLQKILLSATLSKDPERLQQWNLYRPRLFRAAPDGAAVEENGETQLASATADGSTAELDVDAIEGALFLPSNLTQLYCQCEQRLKAVQLYSLLRQRQDQWRKVLCFVNSKLSSFRLTKLLSNLAQGEFTVEEMSKNLHRHRRQQILKRFAARKTRVLVCSDLLARGMDLAEVDCVVNFEAPRDERTYVHRVGRTARAGRSGAALSILTTEEATTFRSLLKVCKLWRGMEELAGVTMADLEDDLKQKYQNALADLRVTVQSKGARSKPDIGPKSNIDHCILNSANL